MNIIKSIDLERLEAGAWPFQAEIDNSLEGLIKTWDDYRMEGEEGFEGNYMGFFCVPWIS